MAYEPISAELYKQNIIGYLITKKSNLTNFKPGSRINTLIEAISLELSRSDYEYYRAYIEGIKEACFDTFGFELKIGEKASGQVRVYNTTPPQNIQIPKFRITLFGIEFESEENPPNMQENDLYIGVNISATSHGQEYNLPENSIDTDLGQGIIDPRFDFGRITNTNAIEGGTDIESNASREQRFQDFIKNLSRVTLSGIESAVNNIAGVVEAYVGQNVNPVTQKEEYGWINVYVSDGTAQTSTPFIEEIEDILEGRSAKNNFTSFIPAGSRLYVSSILIQAISIELNISIDENSSLRNTQIEELISKAVTNYVNRLGPGEDVLLDHIKSAIISTRRNEILYVTINSPQTDISVPERSIPRVGGAGGGVFTITQIQRIQRP